MSDIFISYASEDRGIAERLAGELERKGWSVWWDRRIAIGVPFDAEIERALDRARSVIVLWSRHSVQSEWVRVEARRARQRHVLLPALLEDVEPPLEFSSLQAVPLKEWWGQTDHDGFSRLTSAVTDALRGVGDISSRPAGVGWPSTLNQASRRWGRGLALLLLPAIAVALLASVLATLRVPTDIKLTLLVERVSFTVAGGDALLVRILDGIAFPALTVQRFEAVSMEPAIVEAADPAQYLIAEDRYPESAWIHMSGVAETLRFEALEDRLLPSLTIERSPDDAAAAGNLRPTTVPRGADVMLEVRGANARSFTVGLSHREPALAVPMGPSLRLTAAQTKVVGVDGASVATQTSAWRVHVRETAAPIEIKGRAGGLVASFALPARPPGTALTIFSSGTIPISAVDFSVQDALGNRSSSIVADGQFAYLESGDGPQTVAARTVVRLGELEDFTIRSMALDANRSGLRMELEGRAGVIRTERGPLTTDLRQSALAASRPAWRIVVVIVWLLATGAIAWYVAVRGAQLATNR